MKDLAVTVMCGPFFSVMPFPAKRVYSFSHVSYTPHYEWAEEPCRDYAAHQPPFPLMSRFDQMQRDASRYMPILSKCKQTGSLWEVKTILPQSDANDSRPILFKPDSRVPNVISVLGGKVDNIFDLDDVLFDQLRASKVVAESKQ